MVGICNTVMGIYNTVLYYIDGFSWIVGLNLLLVVVLVLLILLSPHSRDDVNIDDFYVSYVKQSDKWYCKPITENSKKNILSKYCKDIHLNIRPMKQNLFKSHIKTEILNSHY